jgi:tetratricopeptide (TPR) repeat protein
LDCRTSNPPAEGNAVALTPDEMLRVLLVFAQAPGSRPLAMRRERERLLALFQERVLPDHRVQVDVLCHGVSRPALEEAIRDVAGYHIVHWSGHGHHDQLEIIGSDGRPERLTGAGLVELFADAGGFIPHLVFLSACYSGALGQARDWQSFRARLEDPEGTTRGEAEPGLARILTRQGYTSTALELTRAGVPQVIAMRYEVGDAYAQDLGVSFYEHLLADRAHHPADRALALARGRLLRSTSGAYSAVDHVTPLILGDTPQRLLPVAARSPQLRRWYPQPQPLLAGRRDLEAAEHFVGRERVLSRLAAEWLPRHGPAVALLQGLAGLGKTALAAEIIHLWHRRFDWVLAFQTRPTALALEEFYRRLDSRLALESPTYRETTTAFPNRQVYLEPTAALTGEARYEHLQNNLVAALRDERILLVLDNFETNLSTLPHDGAYPANDPAWDRLLARLAEQLPDTGSRVLITSRHRLAALRDPAKTLWIALGPLPLPEAGLFFQSCPPLKELLFGNAEGQQLARRVLEVSRGHPLLLQRLGDLAKDRGALAVALEKLESQGLATLPGLFEGVGSDKEREAERRYLEDVAIGSIDLLLERASPEARSLLWIVTLASEPVRQAMLQGVWSGQTPDVEPLLAEICDAGLLGRDTGESYSFHELVRERTEAWMQRHHEERWNREAEAVWQAYGERYQALFDEISKSGEAGAQEAAAEAGRRGLSYLARARAFDALGPFASKLVTGTRNPALLSGVIAELEAVVDHVPPGAAHWSVQSSLADAFDSVGQPDRALPFYARAALEAEAASAWGDVGTICQNWANALGNVGQLDRAREVYRQSADAQRQAGSPQMSIVGSELGALHIDVMQDRAGEALPQIEERLEAVRGWWRRHRAGEEVPEAPEPVFLGRVMVGALDIARQANRVLERWQSCLDLLAETEETKRAQGASQHELARTRFNRSDPLRRLGQLAEAKQVVEVCLEVFREVDSLPEQASALGALAVIWDALGDLNQAVALERRVLAVSQRLPDPLDRARSHHNLAYYLDRVGEHDEARWHLFAALVYRLVTNNTESLRGTLHYLSILIRWAAASGARYELPRLADILSRPEFQALGNFLIQFGVNSDDLQANIDAGIQELERSVQQRDEPAG